MTAERPRVVFDCVVYVQALISGRGPSAACIEEIKRGAAALLISPQIMAEVREVPLRPALSGRYKHLTREFIETFVKDVERYAASIASPPRRSRCRGTRRMSRISTWPSPPRRGIW